MEREKLQREIYQLTQIIAAKQLSGVSSLDTAELRGPHAQAKAYSRSEAHEGRIATNPDSPARPY
jgi:hypothetical protein